MAAASRMAAELKLAHQRVGQHAVGGGAGDRAHRVHRQVAPQLVPDVAPHVGRVRHIEAGMLQQVGHLLHARAAAAAALRRRSGPAPCGAAPGPGSVVAVLACTTQPTTRSVAMAAADARRRDRRCATARRRAPPRPGRTTTARRSSPAAPACAAPSSGAMPPRHGVERRALDRDHHQVLRPERGRIVAGRGRRLQQRPALLQPPAVRAQRLQRGATRQCADTAPGRPRPAACR